MRFRVLGPLQVEVGGVAIRLGPPKQRLLLAALICHQGETLSADRLVDELWPDAQPASARENLRGYVHRLRAVLGADVLVGRGRSGYALVTPPDSIDGVVFTDRVERGAAAVTGGDPATGRDLLHRALTLWRGPPYADLDDVPALTAERQRLEAYRLLALEHRVDADLRLGTAADLVTELTDLVDRHPYRERFWTQLMLALYRTGRRAEALAAYRRLHRTLAAELGIEPPPEAGRLHEAMLRGDPEAGGPAPSGAGDPGGPARPVPAQLPPDRPAFTGRSRELVALTALTDPPERSGPPIVAIAGPGGIGKTWLAVHWAHRHRDRFPDGQLYVNLRGYDPSGQPMAASDAVRGFLDALGVAPAAVPADLNARVGLYRSLLDGRRALVVLDNARDSAHVAALLPGAATCTVLITSRNRMTGLVSAHGAAALPVDVLPDGAARDLLARRLGEERLADDPDAVDVLIAACAGLPLALGITAARAAVAPDLALSALARELSDAGTRLRALDEGDAQASLRAVLSWSYAALPPVARRTFALMGLAPGPDISAPTVAALTGLPGPEADAAIRTLSRQSLITEQPRGRWRMHDLIQLYAAERAAADLPDRQVRLALRRLVDFLLHTAFAADRLINPDRLLVPPDRSLPGADPYPLADEASALAWLAAEYPGVVAAQRLAAGHGWHRAAWHLAWVLASFQRRTGRMADEAAVWRTGLAAAQRLGDRTAEVLARHSLGEACAGIGLHDEALDHLRLALTLSEKERDLGSQVRCHRAFAFAAEQAGDTRRALHHAVRTLRLCRVLGQPAREADALHMVGWFAARLGHYVWARPYLEAALTLARRRADRSMELEVLDSLGYVTYRAGHPAAARAYYEESLALARERGYAFLEADLHEHLGDAHAELGEPGRARAAWEHALRLYEAQRRTVGADRVRARLADPAPVSRPDG